MPRAPKICSTQGCSSLVRDGGSKCVEQHRIAWANKGFDRRRKDTAAHRAMKSRVLGRVGYRCELKYLGICTGIATSVDRIDNRVGYHDHNCQASCQPCHERKTSDEGHEAQGHTVSTRLVAGEG